MFIRIGYGVCKNCTKSCYGCIHNGLVIVESYHKKYYYKDIDEIENLAKREINKMNAERSKWIMLPKFITEPINPIEPKKVIEISRFTDKRLFHISGHLPNKIRKLKKAA